MRSAVSLCLTLMLTGLSWLPASSQAEVDFDALKGRVVYLDFWASWCGPCRESFPWMQKMHRRYADQGLEVIAVNLDQEAELYQQFLKQFPSDFRIERDPDGKLAEYFGIETMPTSFLIDRDGNAVKRHLGFRKDEEKQYEHEIRQLLESH
ncbi:TlpA family protein disulfide reductase [Oceanobacter mangrovi]|uniref:TlpA family protein disulfide reductase n=1 Tax=Oceanobacter mangrovi TaxID=2862510 RepID=UPI001C8D46D0|nr:TlpA disulfide reductase family protein [Oceanobacter mangrovi]